MPSETIQRLQYGNQIRWMEEKQWAPIKYKFTLLKILFTYTKSAYFWVYWLSSKNLNYDNICSTIITSSKALPQKHSMYNTVQPCSCRILHDLRMDKKWRFFFPSYQRNKGQRESAAVAVFKGSFIGKLKPNTETEMCCWENLSSL